MVLCMQGRIAVEVRINNRNDFIEEVVCTLGPQKLLKLPK